MARMPNTDWQGEKSPRDPMARYDVVCVHTIVGYAPAHAAHFSVRADGSIIQSRDTAYRSGANLEGNHRVIAIENEDHGPRFGGTPRLPKWVPLTPEQVAANARILAWAHETHGVPLQLCPDSRPQSRGLAYHRQGIDGNFGPGTDYPNPGRVPGGETWTESTGKVCPTDARIEQLPDILAAARDLIEGDDMASPETVKQIVDALRPVIDQAVAANKLDVGKKAKWADDTVAQTLIEQNRRILAELAELNRRLAASSAQVPRKP